MRGKLGTQRVALNTDDAFGSPLGVGCAAPNQRVKLPRRGPQCTRDPFGSAMESRIALYELPKTPFPITRRRAHEEERECSIR
jgi:hypothetical protein